MRSEISVHRTGRVQYVKEQRDEGDSISSDFSEGDTSRANGLQTAESASLGNAERDSFNEGAREIFVASTATEFELPFVKEDGLVIRNAEGRYTLLYDTLYKQASWVAYVLTGRDVQQSRAKRRDRFLPDPYLVRNGLPVARPSDYRGTGYDRGHLCPSADRACSQAENECTFYMSNISPQTPALNRGPWKQLEERVREWALKYDSLYVVTGGVLSEGLGTISGGIGVPEFFYKAVLTRNEGEFRAVGFLLPNTGRFRGDYRDYAVSVDSLEVLTSIDFFHNLPDEAEREVESVCSAEFWFE